MDSITETLDTPLFLVAMPQVHDGYFDRSVVLLIQHGEEGSLGLIINKPTQLTVREVVETLDLEWHGAPHEEVWFGGPVNGSLGTVLVRQKDLGGEILEKSIPIAPGLQMIQDVRALRELAAAPPAQMRLVLGYAGWSANQLESELERSDWLIAPYDIELVLGDDSHEAWTHALESIHVRPESLPAVVGGGEQGSN